MKRFGKILLFLAALFPIIGILQGKVSSILIFSVFVSILLWKGLQRWCNKLPLPTWFQFIGLGILFGAFTQIMVQAEGFEKSFSSDPTFHFLQALMIYIWIAIAWYILLKKYEFTTWSTFWITGIFGVIVEGIILYHYINPLQWLFLFVVYGSLGALPHILTHEKFSADRTMPHTKQYIFALFSLILALLAAHISTLILWVFGIR